MVMNANFKVLKVVCLIIQVFWVMMCVVGWMVHDVSKRHSAFVFKVQEAFSWLLRMGHFLTLKCWEMSNDLSIGPKDLTS